MPSSARKRTPNPSKAAPGRALVPPRAGHGRPLGQPNKLSRQAKDDIIAVFVGLGGVKEMTKWAKDNKGAFYTKLYARLIPKDLSVTADAGLEDLLGKLAERHGSVGTEPVDGDYTEIQSHDEDSAS